MKINLVYGGEDVHNNMLEVEASNAEELYQQYIIKVYLEDDPSINEEDIETAIDEYPCWFTSEMFDQIAAGKTFLAECSYAGDDGIMVFGTDAAAANKRFIKNFGKENPDYN